MEIADSTHKKRIYARAGIPVYWIVNLIERQIEVYTQPNSSGEKATYMRRQDFDLSLQVSVMIEGCEIGRLNVRDLLS